MGNTHGIPETTNDEWIVINVKTNIWGNLVPLDQEADARLVDKVSVSPRNSNNYSKNDGNNDSNEGGGRTTGILPQYEYDTKIKSFNDIVGRGRQRMTWTLWVTVLFVATVPQCLRFMSKDIEIWMYFVVTWVPILLLVAFMFYYFSNERKKVQELFAPWKTQYGIDVEWFQGGKRGGVREGAKLGFKLPQSQPLP